MDLYSKHTVFHPVGNLLAKELVSTVNYMREKIKMDVLTALASRWTSSVLISLEKLF